MLWTCRKCGTRFAVGLPFCPHCTGTDIERDEEGMAKTTVHGGPSDQHAEPGQPGYQAPAEAAEVEQATAAAVDASAAAADESEQLGGYQTRTVEDLRVELDRRGVAYSSRDRKDALVAALRADDAGRGNQEA